MINIAILANYQQVLLFKNTPGKGVFLNHPDYPLNLLLLAAVGTLNPSALFTFAVDNGVESIVWFLQKTGMHGGNNHLKQAYCV